MSPPVISAFAAGTPPTTISRSSTPTARARSTVVPFTRPSSGAEVDDASLPSSSLRARPRSLPSASAPSGDGSGSSLRRPAWRPPPVPAPGTAVVGFAAPGAQPAAARPAPGARAVAPSGGLLSRVLCVDGLHVQTAGPSVDADALLAELQATHPVFSSPLVTRAFSVARVAHDGQTAACGGPMLAHAAAVARVVADLGADAAAVAAAVLHAALARGVATEAALGGVVDADVLTLVRAVTRMTDLCLLRRYTAGEAAVDETPATVSQSVDAITSRFIAMLVSMADVRALVVKLAESVVDLRARLAAGAGDTRAAKAAARAALDVYAPLANRLGVWSLKASLEDAAFAVLHPVEHAALAAAAAPAAAADSVNQVLDSVRAALDAAGLAHADVAGRAKNLYGLHVKMVTKGLPLDAVHDARAVRVLVETKAECYAAERAVHALWRPVDGDGRAKDYIRSPKPNGYQSLHSVVVGPDGRAVELQVRTRKMHLIAEHGVAAHWRYKEKDDAPSSSSSSSEAGDDASSASIHDAHDDARVAWARWLTSWCHELDAKATGGGLAALAADVAHAATCTFPDHAPGCGFAAYLSKGLRAGAEAADATAPPRRVLVAVMDHASAAAAAAGPRVEALAPGTTAADVVRATGLPLRALVNNGDRAVDAPLAPGDKVELFAADAPTTPRGAPAAPRAASIDGDLDEARARLDRLLAGPPATPERAARV